MSFLKEDNGNFSMMRVGMLISLLTGCAIGVLGVYKGSDLLTLTGLVSVYMTPIIGKVAQKKHEANK